MSKEERIQEIRERLSKATKHKLTVEKNVRELEDSVHYTIQTAKKLPEHPWSPRFIAWMCGSLGEALHNRDPKESRDDPEVEGDAQLFAHANSDIEFLLSELEPQTVAETTIIEVVRCKDCANMAIAVNDVRHDTSGMFGHGKGKCSGTWTTIAKTSIHSPAPDTKGP